MNAEIPPLENSGGGFTFLYRGKYVYSRHAPCVNPERSATASVIRPSTLVLVCSPCLGYGLQILLSKLPEHCAILAVEAEEPLMAISLSNVSRAIQDDPRYFSVRTDSVDAAVLYARSIGRFRRITRIRLSQADSFNPDFYDRLERSLILDTAEYWKNRATLLKLARPMTRNIFSNLAFIASDEGKERVKPIDSLVTEKPLIVVGAGPSLDCSIPSIKKHRERIFVLSVDTALIPLTANGIVPDLVVCLESQIHNIHDFVGASASGIPVAADLSSHPVSFRGLGGIVYPVFSRFDEGPFVSRVLDLGFNACEIPPLGSVGIAAAWIASTIARNSVYITGLDFSFPRGKVHARGSPSLIRDLLSWNRCRSDSQFASSVRLGVKPELSIEGTVIFSDPVLSGYADLFKNSFCEATNFIDMRTTGIDLGIRIRDTDPDFASRETGSGGMQIPHPFAKQEFGYLRDAISSFFKTERKGLELLYSVLKGHEKTTPESVLARIENHEYLFRHFPDSGKVPNLEQDFLNRILVETMWWLGFLQTFSMK